MTTDAEACAPSPGVSREPSVPDPVNVSDHCAMHYPISGALSTVPTVVCKVSVSRRVVFTRDLSSLTLSFYFYSEVCNSQPVCAEEPRC